MNQRRQLILPPVTQPWGQRIRRSHKQRRIAAVDAWRSYRSCLRWEFAFSCAFCLCHEADLATAGVEGWGLTAIEHFIPKSRDSKQKNSLKNLFYICGRCNLARGIAPNKDASGAVLLNPCEVSWGESFIVTKGRLELRDSNDVDARYTQDTYRLNEASKVRIRRLRQRVIESRKAFLERYRGKKDELFKRAIESGDPELVSMARDIRALQQDATLDLLRFRAIPHDRNRPCRCQSNPSLPDFLRVQAFDLQDLTHDVERPS